MSVIVTDRGFGADDGAEWFDVAPDVDFAALEGQIEGLTAIRVARLR